MPATLVLLFLLCVLPASVTGGIDLGLCSDEHVSCPCGIGTPIRISIRRCTFFRRFRPYCKACNRYNIHDLCRRYIDCATCHSGGCATCPPNRYGHNCGNVCNCLNGAECDNGRCICPVEYRGARCEQRATCATLPPLDHGTSRGGGLTIGTTLHYACNSGFRLERSSERTCLPDGQWSGQMPQCVRLCGQPPNVHNGRTEGGFRTVGAHVRAYCNLGWRMVGSSVLTCSADGSWIPEVPSCERVSCPTFIVENGRIRITGEGPGAIANFSCQPGFISVVNITSTVCGPNGQWLQAETFRCQLSVAVCERPEPIEDGEYEHLNELPITAGDRVRYRCNDGYNVAGRIFRTCNADSTWTGYAPRCIQLIVCDNPGTPRNTVRTIQGPSSTNHGEGLPPMMRRRQNSDTSASNGQLPNGKFQVFTRLVFRCETGFYELHGSRVRTCRTAGTWSGRQPVCLPICGITGGARMPYIVNGNATERGQWPWQAAIFHKLAGGVWTLNCGGTLVNENWVVTAAHCVTGTGSRNIMVNGRIKIGLGKHYNDNRDDDQEFLQMKEVGAVYIHQSYDPSLFDSDIAIIRLVTPATFTHRVRPICLPSRGLANQLSVPGSEGVVTGWGRTETGQPSRVLRMTSVATITNAQCENNYAAAGHQFVITSNMFCAGFDDGRTDTCSGDSGGPLVFISGRGEFRKWYLVGIVSWGSPMGCGVEMQYGGYTKVANFLGWLSEFL